MVAFTFNLDQPQWALLTVFVVSQPQRDGLVLAKSFYRIISTVIGAVVVLLFVALFAQESRKGVFEETKIPRVAPGDEVNIYMMSGGPSLRGHVMSMSRVSCQLMIPRDWEEHRRPQQHSHPRRCTKG